MTRPRILFVAMAHSIHAVRWMNLVAEGEYDVYLYPALYMPKRADLSSRIQIYYPSFWDTSFHPTPSGYIARRAIDFLRGRLNGLPRGSDHQAVAPLVRLIEHIKPDIVHALEMQHGGYLAVQAMERLSGRRPLFGIANWGSDIFLYQHRSEHESWIARLLTQADFYSAECARDLALVKARGYEGKVWPVTPGSAGVEMELVNGLQPSVLPPSQRRHIMIKGYQSFAGRALTTLAALAQCVETIRPFRLCIFSPSFAVKRAFSRFAKTHSLDVTFIENVPYAEMLAWYGKARCYIGSGISDGISTSVLESMAMGCFPIQSNTSCCLEWFEQGKTGFAPPPDNLTGIAAAIKIALTDDILVDRAVPINQETIAKRADDRFIQKNLLAEYAQLLNHT